MTNKKEDEPKSYITASIESTLHKAIMADARRNETSFSKQVQEYRDHVFALEQQVDELRSEIKKIADVN